MSITMVEKIKTDVFLSIFRVKGRRALSLALLVCLTFLAVGLPTVKADEEDLAYKHLYRAEDLKREGDFAGSIKEYQAAWKLAELPEALLEMAMLLDRYFNKNKKAIKLYRKFLRNFPNDRKARRVKKLMKKAKNQVRVEGAWRADIEEMEPLDLTPLKPLPQARIKKKTVVFSQKAEEALKVAADTFTGMPSTCLGCHAGVMGPKINMDATHPVGRVPTGILDETVPLDVRFYRAGQVICLSCHQPKIMHLHENHPEKVYKYLRVDTHDGEDLVLFCGFCHAKKVSPNSFRRMGSEMDDDEGEMELDGLSRGRDESEGEEEVDEDFFAD